MSRRGLRCCAVALGLSCVLGSGAVSLHLSLAALVLPWVARSPSGRLALRRRALALWPLMLGLFLSLALIAAVSGSASDLWLGRAASVGARVLSATVLLSWLTHDLSAAQLEAALIALRLPGSLVALVMETRAFGRQLSETAHAAWAACALRAGLQSPRALRATVGSVAGVVLLRSVDRSQRVATASALRGAGIGLDQASAERGPAPAKLRPNSP